MKIYSISYDLYSPGQNYSQLHEELKKSDWCHPLKSTWLIYTNETASQIYSRLKKYLDTNDSILINEFGSDYTGYLSKEVWEWIKKRKQRYAS